MTDTPKAESMACTKSPVQIPHVVMMPSCRPPRRTLRTTNMVSAPGVSVNIAATHMKAITCESIMLSPVYTVFLAPHAVLAAALVIAHLPSPFWGKANNFRRLFEFLLYYVATIKLAYIEIFP